MNIERLLLVSRAFVARNIAEHVVAATVSWDDAEKKLFLSYYFDRHPNDDDAELCEIALTELLAEFSEIRLASTACGYLPDDGGVSALEGVVYRRN